MEPEDQATTSACDGANHGAERLTRSGEEQAAQTAAALEEEHEQIRPKCFLIVHSVSKRHNIGNLLRSATAFGVHQVCVVGCPKFNTFGSHGSEGFVTIRSYPNLTECCTHLRQNEGCKIVGVEILEQAVPVQKHPFTGSTAFILGNEGQGLSDSQIQHCDSFVYIPQHGDGTASLNVYVAASIVLHHFAIWAEYEERSRTGQKYDVGERPKRTAARGRAPLSPEEILELQRARRAKREAQDPGDFLKAPNDGALEHATSLKDQ